MVDAKDIVTVYAPNLAVLGATTLDAVETTLSIVLLTVTIVFTAYKCWRLVTNKDDK